MTLLTDAEVDAALARLPGWRRRGVAIEREFEFAGFPEAVAFVARLVPGAEAADHHPDLTISYRRVTVSWTTHSAGGLTVKDIEGARLAEGVREAGA
ncbi:MAG: 4a-hydroxytetrahydrobiopterin dehydratase [Vicinamibacterales bacterium]